MKTSTIKYFSFVIFFLFLVACSVKKNTFISRNSHALSTKDNILYNGGLALDKGILELKSQYTDNFWQLLPIERMQVAKEQTLPGDPPRNPNFERAETKATKAIQKHSMNIGGSEKNYQMDEAHLLLGKSRYYDQRFVPALEAFNYVLYKHANSNKINEVKIWREKTNMRLDNDAIAVENLRRLFQEIKYKDQIYADANATLSQAFLNLGEKDSAVARLKLARDFTKSKEEKARYRFILGQLYEQLGQKDSAYISYQEVIDMKRKAARQYVIHAHLRQANLNDFEKGDTLAFLEKYRKLLKDRENRPYLNFINHEMGLFYEKQHNDSLAIKHYNISLNSKVVDKYLTASNYRNLGDIYFKKAKYVIAGKYYDSTLVQLEPRTREHRFITKKRENLEDVIKYEGIAIRNDSILRIHSLSDAEKLAYYEGYISKLKKADEKKLALQKEAERKGEITGKSTVDKDGRELNPNDAITQKKPPRPSEPRPIASSGGSSKFYFYNPSTVTFGIAEFKKKWGDRPYKNGWRITQEKIGSVTDNNEKDAEDKQDPDNASEKKEDPKYNPEFYVKQLPRKQTEIDSIAKERNFAYYQLGVIYKEKFKEYQLAAAKLETLLTNKPEERLVLPSMYNLYKIYEIIDKDKALAMKNRIIAEFPDSRYAQILGNPTGSGNTLTDTPEANYDRIFKLYESGDIKTTLSNLNAAIDQFTGEEIVPKFELLKANVLGRLAGLTEYKKTLNFVALNYPNSTEGKFAEELLKTTVPAMESQNFYEVKPLSWKILYKSDNPEDKVSKNIQDKIKKFISERSLDKLSLSYDIYTMDKNFIVIHGLKDLEYAKGIASILKEFKDYKIAETAYIISNENYKIVQMKKNFEQYLTTPYSDPLPPKPYVPKNRTMAPKNTQEREKAVRERKDEEDKPSQFNQLPPGIPGIPGQNPTSPVNPKEREQKGEKR
ncbi:type IX secretion system periplasmic lipoprotein PorW/SprE [Flavobacterium lotistagni]|uniref:type IX secretion system periplasmic lipoprotein PorW/SprE n=1 Tax=Flavobacterium lotistagni TaxID=2709660 RepID=UPI001F17FC68|nr:gliding motility protein [Flavobacterium lotistagni]